MNEANQCPIEDKSDLPWSPTLPEGNILQAGDLWRALLDPECKTKARANAIQRAALSKLGLYGNECPQELRDKLDKMCS